MNELSLYDPNITMFRLRLSSISATCNANPQRSKSQIKDPVAIVYYFCFGLFSCVLLDWLFQLSFI